MDCNLSKLLLSLGRADRGTDDQAALDRHLADCPACAAFATRSTGFDAAVVAAMSAVPVPPTLRDDLLKAAYTRQGAIWRRTVYRYAGLAAALLLAVGLVSGGLWRFRPAVDGAELVRAAERDGDFRDEAVRAWLTAQELPTDFPFEMDLDLRLCVFQGKGELAGREMPMLLFQRGQEQARLYIVRDSQLNLTDFHPDERSVWKTTSARHPTARGVVYVAVYTNALDQFRKQPIIQGV